MRISLPNTKMTINQFILLRYNLWSNHLDSICNILSKIEMHIWNQQWCLSMPYMLSILVLLRPIILSSSQYTALSQRYQKLASFLVCNILQEGLLLLSLSCLCHFNYFWCTFGFISRGEQNILYHIYRTFKSNYCKHQVHLFCCINKEKVLSYIYVEHWTHNYWFFDPMDFDYY